MPHAKRKRRAVRRLYGRWLHVCPESICPPHSFHNVCTDRLIDKLKNGSVRRGAH
jgi:hypothetical protein